MNRREKVAKALHEFAENGLSSEGNDNRLEDKTLPEAEALVDNDPYAFLIAVIGDYGVRASRAWNLPFLLKLRLGHLDPSKIAAMAPEGLRRAMEEPFPLHRFPKNVARFIWESTRLLVQRYGGRAEAIWNDHPRSEDIQNRLEDFPGIGQKKASMATNILVRDYKIDVADRRGIDASFDVHVRRVFWRTGLVVDPTMDQILNAARELSPAYPGGLDLPAWTIGREYCHPRNPDCSRCPLARVCPKFHLREAPPG